MLFRFAGRGPRPTYWVRRFENTDNPAFCFTDKGCEWINEGPRPPLCVHLWVCVHTHTHTHQGSEIKNLHKFFKSTILFLLYQTTYVDHFLMFSLLFVLVKYHYKNCDHHEGSRYSKLE